MARFSPSEGFIANTRHFAKRSTPDA